jgi:hypothetical protein
MEMRKQGAIAGMAVTVVAAMAAAGIFVFAGRGSDAAAQSSRSTTESMPRPSRAAGPSW